MDIYLQTHPVANDNIYREFVVVYFVNPNMKQVYLLKKSCRNKEKVNHLHNKLVGIGGEIEEIDLEGNLENSNSYLFNAVRREVKEEIEYEIEDDRELIYSGLMIDHHGFFVHYFKFFITEDLPIGKTKDGILSYYPISHLSRKKSFPYAYTSHLEKMLVDNIAFNRFDIRDTKEYIDFLKNI